MSMSVFPLFIRRYLSNMKKFQHEKKNFQHEKNISNMSLRDVIPTNLLRKNHAEKLSNQSSDAMV